MTTSFFDDLEMKPADPIFGLNAEFHKDPRKHKTNLIIGVSVEEDGSAPHILETVKEAEKILIEKEITKDYLGIDGDITFSEGIVRLVLGDSLYEQNVDRIYAAQTPGGAAALRLIIEFLQKNVSGNIAVSDPTWANHITMANYLGMQLFYYPYYDKMQHTLRFEECVDFFTNLKPKTIVLLQAATHNPTGIDFSPKQWKVLAEVFKKHHLIPLFDIAYQGFGVGLEEDVESVRLFVEEGIECFVAYSCSKNFAIYSERVGALFVVASHASAKPKIASQIKAAIRANYSNPPRHGASVVSIILQDDRLRREWEGELQEMASRICKKRKMLADALGKEYEFLKEAKGFFSVLGVTSEGARELKEDYAIYVTSIGRINLAAVNQNNIERIVDSVLKVSGKK